MMIMMMMVMVIMTTTTMIMTKITFELDGSPLPREEDSEESERFEEEESSACCREELHEEEEEEEQEVEGKEEGEEGWRRCLLSHVEPELMERSRGNSWRKQRILFQRVFGHVEGGIWNIFGKWRSFVFEDVFCVEC